MVMTVPVEAVMVTIEADSPNRGREIANREEVLRAPVETLSHQVHIYKKYHSVCPIVGIGTLPPPLSPASVPLPPGTKGGGHTRLGERVGGVGGVPIQTTGEKLSTLPTLCCDYCRSRESA